MIFKNREEFIRFSIQQKQNPVKDVEAAPKEKSSKFLRKYQINSSSSSSISVSDRIRKTQLQENLFSNLVQASKKANEDNNTSSSKNSSYHSDEEDSEKIDNHHSALHFKKPLGQGGIKTDDYDFYGSKRSTSIDWSQCLKGKETTDDHKLDTTSNNLDITHKIPTSRLETIGQTAPPVDPTYCNYTKNSLKPDFALKKEDNIVPKQGISDLSVLKLENDLKDSCKGIIETSGYEIIEPVDNELDIIHKMMRKKPPATEKLVEACKIRIAEPPKVEVLVEDYERVINKVVRVRDFGTQWCEEDFSVSVRITSQETKQSFLKNLLKNKRSEATNSDHKPEVEQREFFETDVSGSKLKNQEIETSRAEDSNNEAKTEEITNNLCSRLTSKEVFQRELENFENNEQQEDEEVDEMETLENEGKLFDNDSMILEKDAYKDDDNKSEDFNLGVDDYDGFDVVNFEGTDIFEHLLNQFKMYKEAYAKKIEANGASLEEVETDHENDDENKQKIERTEDDRENDEISEDTTSFATALDSSLKCKLYGSQNSIAELSMDEM